MSLDERWRSDAVTRWVRTTTRWRARAWRLAFRSTFGPGCRVGRGLTVENPGQITLGAGVILHHRVMLLARSPDGGRVPTISIGPKTFLNTGAVVAAGERVEIGTDVLIGPYTCVVDQDHRFDLPGLAIARQGMVDRGPIVIGDGSWIATGAVVLGGTTLAPGSVVAAGSVVRGHYPERCVLAGAPARVVRLLDAEA